MADPPECFGTICVRSIQGHSDAFRGIPRRSAFPRAPKTLANTPRMATKWQPSCAGCSRNVCGGVRQRTAADLLQLTQSVGDRLARVQAIHRRGEPEAVIPQFVVDHGVDLVVMGTVARRGIPGLLIGNTAERILRKLPCSVLAVKPDGFVSPVGLDGV